MDPIFNLEDNKDRVVYLIVEFKWLIVGGLLSISGLIMYYFPREELPTIPIWVAAVAWAYLLLGPPSYVAGSSIAKWLRKRNWVKVMECNAVEDTAEPYLVPPEVWEDREVEGDDKPYMLPSGVWVVRSFEYLDDLEQLRVEGVWLSNATDMEIWTVHRRLEQMFGWLEGRAKKAAEYRAVGSVMGLDIQAALVNEITELVERGTLSDEGAVQDAIDRAMNEFMDDVEPPSLADLDDVEPAVEVEDAPDLELAPDADPLMNDGGQQHE